MAKSKSSQKKVQEIINFVEGGKFKEEVKKELEEIEKERESEIGKKLMRNVLLTKKTNVLEAYKNAKFSILRDKAREEIKEISNHNGNGQTEERKEKIKKICQELYDKTEKIRLLEINDFLN